MNVNVLMGGQLDEHLLFWQPTISIIFYMLIALYLFLLFEMEIKYADDDFDRITDTATAYRSKQFTHK